MDLASLSLKPTATPFTTKDSSVAQEPGNLVVGEEMQKDAIRVKFEVHQGVLFALAKTIGW